MPKAKILKKSDKVVKPVKKQKLPVIVPKVVLTKLQKTEAKLKAALAEIQVLTAPVVEEPVRRTGPWVTS